jgi:hypothetical protein
VSRVRTFYHAWHRILLVPTMVVLVVVVALPDPPWLYPTAALVLAVALVGWRLLLRARLSDGTLCARDGGTLKGVSFDIHGIVAARRAELRYGGTKGWELRHRDKGCAFVPESTVEDPELSSVLQRLGVVDDADSIDTA